MIKTIEFDQDFAPEDLANALMNAGFPSDAAIGTIAKGGYQDCDPDSSITLDCSIDEEDAIERISDEAILEAAADLSNGPDEGALEDGIRYVRAGDRDLAIAMFSRLYDDRQMAAVERALS